MVFILIPGVPKVAGWFELSFCKCALDCHIIPGFLFFVAALIAGLVFGIRYFIKAKKGSSKLYNDLSDSNYDRVFIICHDNDKVVSKTSDESE